MVMAQSLYRPSKMNSLRKGAGNYSQNREACSKNTEFYQPEPKRRRGDFRTWDLGNVRCYPESRIRRIGWHVRY